MALQGGAGRVFKVNAVMRVVQDKSRLGAARERGVCPTGCEHVLGRAVPACAVSCSVICVVCVLYHTFLRS